MLLGEPMRVFLFLIALLTLAADWPMGGRSFTRNAVSDEKNPPIDWQTETAEAKERNIKWKVDVGSRALGGPIVAGGIVWVGSNNEKLDKDTTDYAVLNAIRESDGKLLWRYESPRVEQRKPGEFTDWPRQSLSGSPLVEGNRIWFCTNRREVMCYDFSPLRQGKSHPKFLWKLDMAKDLGVAYGGLHIPGYDTIGSPTSYKDYLYVPTGVVGGEGTDRKAKHGPGLVCLHKDTGKVVWSVDSPLRKSFFFGFYASPTVIEVAGRGQAIVAQADGWVRSFDAITGRQIWEFDPNPKDASEDPMDDNPRMGVVATTVSANGKLYLALGLSPEEGGGPGCVYCIDPTKTDDVSAEIRDKAGKVIKNPNSAVMWRFMGDNGNKKERLHATSASIVVHDGFAIAVDRHGIVHCLDAGTGKQYCAHDTKQSVHATPLIVDGKVFVAGDSGDVFVFELAKSMRQLNRMEMDAPIVAPVVFANGVLYVLTERTIYAIAKL